MWLCWAFYTRDIEAMALNNLGAARLELGARDEAAAAFREALALIHNIRFRTSTWPFSRNFKAIGQLRNRMSKRRHPGVLAARRSIGSLPLLPGCTRGTKAAVRARLKNNLTPILIRGRELRFSGPSGLLLSRREFQS
jgi:hypothetical protein